MGHENVIEVESLVTQFGTQRVHDSLSFSVRAGGIVAIIGGSGCGKSTLLKEIIGLQRPTDGTIRLFGVDVWRAEENSLRSIRGRYGVLFQNGALFSGLNVKENIALPLREVGVTDEDFIDNLVRLRLLLVGLNASVGCKMPSELSGGMRKRVALARALVMEPELVFLDEPTSGLDPISARAFDHLMRTLSESLSLTVVMVTHDLDSICSIAHRVLVLGEGKILADGNVATVKESPHPWIQDYFSARAE